MLLRCHENFKLIYALPHNLPTLEAFQLLKELTFVILIFCYIVLFTFQDADEEVFEDNPEEYIRRDIEGSGKELVHDICMGIVPSGRF